MRLGEILGLRWQDVDRAAGVLHIRHVRGRHVRVTLGPPKTHRSLRPVAPDAATTAVLGRQARLQAAQRNRLGADWVESGLVITTEIGSPANPRNVTRAREAAQKRAGVPLLSFRDMRHTHATLLRQQGVDWRVIADRLGHTEITFTTQTYMHSELSEQREASAKVAARLLPDGLPNESVP
jgi:integrase